MPARLPDDEAERLAVLKDHRILDTLPEEEFDDLVRLAAHVCGTPIAAVSLVDERRQWFKAMTGLSLSETPRDAAFCAHTILQRDMMVVPDTTQDDRFKDNPLVTGQPDVRFYAGVPLVTEDGHALGSLCIIDRKPKTLTLDQSETLRLLARQVSSHLRSARRLAEQQKAVAEEKRLVAEQQEMVIERERLLANQERLILEKERAETERLRLAAIVETCDDAIYSVTLDRTLTSWNGGAERLYGCAAAEVVGRQVDMFVPAERREELQRVMEAVCCGEVLAPLETVRITRAGTRVDVSLRVSRIVNPEGRVVGACMIARDITERKKAEAVLEAEREFTHALLESLQEGIVACDATGTLTLFNRASRELHGLPAEPLPPEQWAEHFDLYTADGLSPMRTEAIPLMRAFQGEIVRDAEMVVAPKFGPARTLLSNGRAIYGAGGVKLGAVVAMHDVTERRRIERELSRLAAIVESSEEAILAATLDGTLVSWNRGAEKLYGYAVSEMIGQNAAVLAMPGEKSPVPAAVTRLLRGEAVEAVEVTHTRRDGTEFHAVLSFSPIRDTAGGMVGLSCIARDITERKKAEKALAESRAALQDSESRLRRFTDAAFEGIAISQDGRLVEVSRAFTVKFGYDTPEEMIGLVAAELAAPESQGLAAHHITTCSEESYEAVLVRRDGSTFQAELRGRLIQLGGRAARVTAVRDITEHKAMEAALRRSAELLREREASLRAVLEAVPVILYAADRSGVVTLSEGTGLTALGLKAGEAVGRSVFEFSGGDPRIEENIRRALAGEAVSYDARVYGLCLHTEIRPIQGADGLPNGMIGVGFDVTERVLSEERFRALFERSSHAHLLFDEVGGILDCNAAALVMMRCKDKKQLLGMHPALLSPEFQPDGRRSGEKGAEMCAVAREKGGHCFEWIRRAADGYEYPVEVTLTPVTLAGRPVLLSVWHDLTERKRHEEQLQDHAVILEFQKGELEKVNAELAALATTDGLTGIKNHRAFQERLAVEVNRSERYGPALSLILLDVDQFKQYNDTFGHPQGDEVLRRVASLLREAARETDLVARYGGEEFALILPETDLDGAAAFAERLRAAAEESSWPLREVTASFGVASLRLGESGADLIARADVAMYHSKKEGRNRVTCSTATGAAVG